MTQTPKPQPTQKLTDAQDQVSRSIKSIKTEVPPNYKVKPDVDETKSYKEKPKYSTQFNKNATSNFLELQKKRKELQQNKKTILTKTSEKLSEFANIVKSKNV